MQQILENQKNPHQAYSIITALLPSHQAGNITDHDKTLRALKTIQKNKCATTFPDSGQNLYSEYLGGKRSNKSISAELLKDWENAHENKNDAYAWQLTFIRNLPISMATKRQQKNQLKAKYGDATKIKRARDRHQKDPWNQLKENVSEFLSHLAVWHNSIRKIEGQFGTSVASYFILIRWCLFLNVIISIITMLVIVMPQIIVSQNVNISSTLDENIEKCSKLYRNYSLSRTDALSYVVDFLQGTGWMEMTHLFIGFYDGLVLIQQSFTFSLPVGYLCAIIVVILISLIRMLQTTATGIKEGTVVSGQLHNYCNTVFAGWDFCITKNDAADLKHEMLTTELMSFLEHERIKREQNGRTRKEKAIIYLQRIVINILILSILLAGCFGIYEVSNYSLERLRNDRQLSKANSFEQLSAQYLPSFIITVMNIFLPIVFYKLILFEKYSPGRTIKVNLGRTVLLRLASIAVLLYSFQTQISNLKDARQTCGINYTTQKNYTNIAENYTIDDVSIADIHNHTYILCWETYIGQQIYKLVLLDFIIIMALTFGVGFLRMILVTRLNNKFFKLIGQEQFDIPQNVLDLVYSQTLCWLGVFFSPLLPLACVLKFIIFFYVKKFHLMINCVPSTQPYRASKSNSFFMIVLLVSFGLLVLIPLLYTVSQFAPSLGCSPYRSNNAIIWEVIPESISHWPKFLHEIIKLLTSAAFAIPIIVILILIIYYYYTIAGAYTKMAVVLRDHLLMEGRDKQFLLRRIQKLHEKINKKMQTLQVEAQNKAIRYRPTSSSTN